MKVLAPAATAARESSRPSMPTNRTTPPLAMASERVQSMEEPERAMVQEVVLEIERGATEVPAAFFTSVTLSMVTVGVAPPRPS